MKKRKTQKQKTGEWAEETAAAYFEQKGFEVFERNYRHKKSEVDLIVGRDKLLVFVEVKFRLGDDFGYAEQFVSTKQQNMIMLAAEEYMQAIHWSENVRFDIVAIDGQGVLEHFEDAFY